MNLKVLSVRTGIGTGRAFRELSPSSPNRFSPQQYILPTCVRAQLELKPVATATTRELGGRSGSSNSRGSTASVHATTARVGTTRRETRRLVWPDEDSSKRIARRLRLPMF